MLVGGLLLVLTFRGFSYPNLAQWVGMFDTVVVILGAAALYLYLAFAEIFADSNDLGQVTFVGRVKRFPGSRIDHAVRFTVSGRYGNNPYLAFVEQAGAQVFKVSGMYWDQGELDAFCAAAGGWDTEGAQATTGNYIRLQGMSWLELLGWQGRGGVEGVQEPRWLPPADCRVVDRSPPIDKTQLLCDRPCKLSSSQPSLSRN